MRLTLILKFQGSRVKGPDQVQDSEQGKEMDRRRKRYNLQNKREHQGKKVNNPKISQTMLTLTSQSISKKSKKSGNRNPRSQTKC